MLSRADELTAGETGTLSSPQFGEIAVTVVRIGQNRQHLRFAEEPAATRRIAGWIAQNDASPMAA
jgi:hypothetical protein